MPPVIATYCGARVTTSLRHLTLSLFALSLAGCAAPSGKAPILSTKSTATIEAVKTADQPPAAKDIRVVVRSAAEIAAAKQGMTGSLPLVAKPLTDDLFQVLVFDHPESQRFATTADIDQLKLSEGDALSLGLQNIAATLPPLASVTHDLAPHQIGVIQGDAYDSSRILLAKDWASLAQKLDGHLLVAVPASDTVLYAEENGTQSVRALASLARDSAAKSQRAVSADLLRWTPAGWQKVGIP
jgi:uncharacterized protein YtpQ (UPF0354 family)